MLKTTVAFFLLVLSFNIAAQEPANGKVMRTAADTVSAWDADAQQWVGIEAFWLNYAERNGGLTWGRGTDYPPYDEVSEFDTFMVEVDQGPCLMEFFHSRWRRANDVRRWDDEFNRYGGCPAVFD